MTPSPIARAVIAAIAWLVPADARRDWRREWHAELTWYASNGRSAWAQTRHARGAWRHACWLRADRWRTGTTLDLRDGVRALRARPAVAAIAVLTLGLGIGANTAIFSVAHALLWRALPYPDAGQLVSIYATHRRSHMDRGVERPEDIQYWMDHAATTSHIAAIGGGAATVTTGGQPARLRYSDVPPVFFPIMGVAPALGRVFTDDETSAGERVVVVSDAVWRSRLGGTRDLYSATLDLDGQPWRVIGVMPARFRFPVDVAMWRPFDFSRARKVWYLGSVARLRPGVTLHAAQLEFDRMAADLEREFPTARKDRGFNVVGLQEDLAFRSIDGIRLLQGGVALVLLIACANVANLLLAQASVRRREFAMRAALGASRGRVVRQLLTESVVLAMAGAALGAAIAVPVVRTLVAMAPPALLPYPDDVGVNWTVLGFTAALAAVTGLVFGLAPAVLLSTPGPTPVLGQGWRAASAGLSFSRRQWLRGTLVVSEIALALVLLVGSGLLLRSVALLSAQAPGFKADGLLTAQLSLTPARYATTAARQHFWLSLVQALDLEPAATKAAISSALPFSAWEWQSDFIVEGREHVPNTGVDLREVSAGYFDVLEIPVLRGRGIVGADRADSPPVAVVSDAFVSQHMAGLDPIGHRLKLERGDPWLTIAGVVGSTRHMTLAEPRRAEIYVPALQRAGHSSLHIAIRTTGDPRTLIAPLRRVVASLDARLPLESVKPMTQMIAASDAERHFLTSLLALLAGLAAALAVVGVYGVTSFLVSSGRREIAVRLALGARPVQVERRLLAQGLRVVAVGATAGVLAALWLSRLLASQLFGITLNDPLTITLATVMLAGAAALACWIPARRVTRVDPTESLRDV